MTLPIDGVSVEGERPNGINGSITWLVVAIITMATLRSSVSYAVDQRVFTPEVLGLVQRSLAEAGHGGLQSISASRLIGGHIALTALLAIVRITGVALLLHGALLLSHKPVAFRGLLWTSTTGFAVLTLGEILRASLLLNNRTGLPSIAQLATMPGSLANVFLTQSQLLTPFGSLLNSVNVFEMGWVVLVSWGLRIVGETWKIAFALSAGCWLGLSVGSWGILQILRIMS